MIRSAGVGTQHPAGHELPVVAGALAPRSRADTVLEHFHDRSWRPCCATLSQMPRAKATATCPP